MNYKFWFFNIIRKYRLIFHNIKKWNRYINSFASFALSSAECKTHYPENGSVFWRKKIVCFWVKFWYPCFRGKFGFPVDTCHPNIGFYGHVTLRHTSSKQQTTSYIYIWSNKLWLIKGSTGFPIKDACVSKMKNIPDLLSDNKEG